MPTEQEFAELKAEVARLTTLVEQLYYRSGTPMPSGGLPTVDSPPSEIVDLIREGRAIEAIKLWRERTGLGLGEAKRDIDEIARRFG